MEVEVSFRFSTSAESKSDPHIMSRDTLKTVKKRFGFREGSRTQKKGRNEGTERGLHFRERPVQKKVGGRTVLKQECNSDKGSRGNNLELQDHSVYI